MIRIEWSVVDAAGDDGGETFDSYEQALSCAVALAEEDPNDHFTVMRRTVSVSPWEPWKAVG